jgi:cell division transport system permease protein
MSAMDARLDTGRADATQSERQGRRRQTGVVPPRSIAGRALIAVVAIMTFLAALTIGAVDLVRSAAVSWEGEIVREVTVQVRPVEGQNQEAQVQRAAEIARGTPGIASVRPYSDGESAALLEPWLGAGLDLSGLPVPRLIVLEIGDGTPDLAVLREQLAREVTGASLDDHRQWVDRLRGMSGAIVGIGVAVLALVVTATLFSVVFATRGTMAGNSEVIEVLNLVGATDRYIAREFQHRFLRLGLTGGAIGGGLAMLLFLAASQLIDVGAGSLVAGQAEVLFGRFALGWSSYLYVALTALGIGIATAATSRITVMRYLRRKD